MDGASLSVAQFLAFTWDLNVKENTLDDNLPVLPLPYYESDQDAQRPPEFDLAILDRLPLELIQMCVAHLDLETLLEFRKVNRRAKQVVNSTAEYKRIVQHAPAVIQAILSIGMGSWISCADIYQQLRTPECQKCGDFGGYFYILGCQRVCFLCFTGHEDFHPLNTIRAEWKFGLTKQSVAALPRMTTVTGIYTPMHRPRQYSLEFVDPATAHLQGIKLHGSQSAMDLYVAKKQKKLEKRREARRGRLKPLSSQYALDRMLQTLDEKSANPLRFVAIVCFPWLNAATGKSERGRWCIACRHLRTRPTHFQRRFSIEMFQEHLKECGAIVNGEHKLPYSNYALSESNEPRSPNAI